MKLRYISIACLGLMLSTGSCSDFLDKEPLSEGTEVIFYKTPEQFKQAANAFYDNIIAWKDYNNNPYTTMDGGTDIAGLSTNGGGVAGENDNYWNKPYEYIRRYNILLEKAAAYEGNQDDIKPYMGAAYFFRAWQHFQLLRTYGGVPLATERLDLESPQLQEKRNSRYEVVAQIIADLKLAVEYLPKETEIAKDDKGQVSKEAAKSFLARVALYEATWEKYATPGNIGMDLDGDGASVGAGKSKPSDYPSIENLLGMAQQMSKEVIQEAEAGTFELWQKCDTLSYYYLFNLDDDGASNPAGAGKSSNKEFIFKTKYDKEKRCPGINITHTWPVSISTQLGESFLCRNGLPIRISDSPDMSAARNNPEYLGNAKFCDEFRNRDYRFISTTASIPDRCYWGYGGSTDGGGMKTLQPYPDPEEWAAKKLPLHNPTLRGGTFSGYSCRKFRTESPNREERQESYDFPQIRLAEVHLIYAEATCELGNGTISDGDLNFSINKNRARAGVAPLTNALIANVYDAGWWDHKQGKTVVKKMNMTDEIRRERACELYGEGFRMDDLKRWGIAQVNLTGLKLGNHLYGTEYMTAVDNNPYSATYEAPCYWPKRYPLTYGVYDESKGVSASDPDYGRTIATFPEGLKYVVKDYLNPIPLGQIKLNPQLKQNPGW